MTLGSIKLKPAPTRTVTLVCNYDGTATMSVHVEGKEAGAGELAYDGDEIPPEYYAAMNLAFEHSWQAKRDQEKANS